jgi:hypothetical protein
MHPFVTAAMLQGDIIKQVCVVALFHTIMVAGEIATILRPGSEPWIFTSNALINVVVGQKREL